MASERVMTDELTLRMRRGFKSDVRHALFSQRRVGISFIFRIVTRFARCRRNRVDFLHDARLESIDDESG